MFSLYLTETTSSSKHQERRHDNDAIVKCPKHYVNIRIELGDNDFQNQRTDKNHTKMLVGITF